MAGRLTAEKRFARKVARTDSCWLWTGAMRPNGYGNFGMNGKTIGAHRVAWILANGPIPEGLHVLHRCDVRNCVNPEHLFLGSHQDNMDDMAAKGRRVTPDKHGAANPMHGKHHSEIARGRMAAIRRGKYTRENHPRATITQAVAAEIKMRRQRGDTCKSISAELGVSFHIVRNVAGGKSWRT